MASPARPAQSTGTTQEEAAASPARPAQSTGTTQEEAAARQSLMGISQSVPVAGEALSVPNGRMEHGGDESLAADKYRSMLMSIANQSPEARQQPTPCPRTNGVA